MAARTIVIPSSTGAEPQVLRYDDGAMSHRGRALAWLIAALLLVGGTGVLAANGLTPLSGTPTGVSGTTGSTGSAGSSGATGTTTGSAVSGTTSTVPDDATAVSGVIVAEWDGPTVHVDWAGSSYTTVEADFIGDRVATPGDRVSRTLSLVNAGPTDAVMTVSLTVDQTQPDDALNPALAEHIDLFWDVAGVTGTDRFATLLDLTNPTIAEVSVPHGATALITVGFEMPTAVTDQQNAGLDSTALSFQLNARMQGQYSSGVLPATPDLAITGTQVLGALLIVVGLLLVGWLLLLIARRRRFCDDCDERIQRGEAWSVHHDDDGARRVQCARCRDGARV